MRLKIGTLDSDNFYHKEYFEYHIQSLCKTNQHRDHMLMHYVQTTKAIAITREYDIILTYFVQIEKEKSITREILI